MATILCGSFLSNCLKDLTPFPLSKGEGEMAKSDAFIDHFVLPSTKGEGKMAKSDNLFIDHCRTPLSFGEGQGVRSEVAICK
jgi:hypothetical protein